MSESSKLTKEQLKLLTDDEACRLSCMYAIATAMLAPGAVEELKHMVDTHEDPAAMEYMAAANMFLLACSTFETKVFAAHDLPVDCQRFPTDSAIDKFMTELAELSEAAHGTVH